MQKHLAIFSKQYLDQIFSGKKTVEARFSQKLIPPFAQVKVGDKVYIKLSGGDIKGQFTVKKVLFFAGLDQSDWALIKTHYGLSMFSGSPTQDQEFFQQHQPAKYATIIFIGNVEQFITSPIKVPKKDKRGWVVLG